jgi:hypothetical protein
MAMSGSASEDIPSFAVLALGDGTLQIFAVLGETWSPVGLLSSGGNHAAEALAWAPLALAETRDLWLAIAGDDHVIRIVDCAFLHAGKKICESFPHRPP